jgi:hypothetical protein
MKLDQLHKKLKYINNMSSPFQQKFMAKNPVKGFTMDQLEKSTKKAEKQMKKSAAILPQVEGPGNPDYESKDEQRFAGDDGYDDSVEKTQVSNGSVAQMASPLNAYVSTAGHFQRLQDNIAAAFTPKKKTGPTSEDKKNQAEEAYWKSKTTTSEENNPFKGETEKVVEKLKETTDEGFEYKPFESYGNYFNKTGQ